VFGRRWFGGRYFAPTYFGDGGTLAPPEPPAPTGTGGGWRGTEDDVLAIERLLKQRGRAKVVASPFEAWGEGAVRNPVAPKEVPPEVVPEEIVPPSPVFGEMTAMVGRFECDAMGSVGLGSKDQAVAVAAALNDPLADWLRKELGL